MIMKKNIEVVLHFSSSKMLEKPFYFVIYAVDNGKRSEFMYKIRYCSEERVHESDIFDIALDDEGLEYLKGQSFNRVLDILLPMFKHFGFNHDVIRSPIASAGFEGGGEIIYKELTLGKKTHKYFREGGGLILDADDKEHWSSGRQQVKSKDLLSASTFGFFSWYRDCDFIQEDYKHVYEFGLKQHLLAEYLWDELTKAL